MDLAPGPAPQISVEGFAARRRRVAADLPEGGLLVVATHPEAVFSNDVHHRFRPQSDFWYLTGFQEPGGILALEASGESHLFLRPRKPEAEVWDGRRLGIERAAEALDVDFAHDRDDFSRWLRERLAPLQGSGRRRTGKAASPQATPVLAITEHDPWVHRRLRNACEPADGRPLLAKHRVIKDAREIKLIQRAIDVSVEAHEAAREVVRPGCKEYQIEAALLASFRSAGSTGPGYPPIVGAGDNASILHYISNQDRVGTSQTVLIDAGCEWGYYNADITRTWASSPLSDTAARLHDVVVEAQRAAVAAVAPGVRIREVHEVACRVLVEGLQAEGVLDPSEDASTLVASGAHRPYYMHGTSHYLGLDVHDAGDYRDPTDGGGHDAERGPKSRRLEPGMVITVEPGLYFNPDFAPASPRQMRGLGVRIEDDILVTESGRRNLSRALSVDA